MSTKLIVTKNNDGSLKFTLDTALPELEEGERLTLELDLDIEDSPAKAAADTLAAVNAEWAAAKADVKAARKAKK